MVTPAEADEFDEWNRLAEEGWVERWQPTRRSPRRDWLWVRPVDGELLVFPGSRDRPRPHGGAHYRLNGNMAYRTLSHPEGPSSVPWLVIRRRRVYPAEGHRDAGSEVPRYLVGAVRRKEVGSKIGLVGVRLGPEPAPVAWSDLGAMSQNLQQHLDARVARLPMRRLRKWNDLSELRAVESDHVERLADRYSLSDSDHAALQRLWFERIDAELAEVTEHLRDIEMTRQRRIHRRYDRLGDYYLGQLYWNTLGPGGETWFGDHVPVRRFLFRLHWRP